MKDMEFSALLCSRLCHDLISPVGAIANGLEILDDENDDEMRTEVMALLAQSAEVTTAKLKFFRLCFGAGGGFGEKLPLGEAEQVVRGLYAASNIDLVWKSDVAVLDKNAVKLMLNMVLVAGETLVRGGRLQVEISGQASVIGVRVGAHGDRIVFQDYVRGVLVGEQTEIGTKSAPAFLAVMLANALGSRIEYIAHNDQSFSLDVTYSQS